MTVTGLSGSQSYRSMPLTDAAIRKTRPAERLVKLNDGEGLYSLLRPNGTRWWRWDYPATGYRLPATGRLNTLSLGVYPELGKANARVRRHDNRRLLAADIDSGQQRKVVQASEQAQAANSFEVVAREWPAMKNLEWTDPQWQKKK